MPIKYYLNLDENNYLLSISTLNNGDPSIDSIEEYDLTGLRPQAYRYEDGKLIFDEQRYAELTSAQEDASRKAYLESIKPNDTEMALVELAELYSELQSAIVELGDLVSDLTERGNV